MFMFIFWFCYYKREAVLLLLFEAQMDPLTSALPTKRWNFSALPPSHVGVRRKLGWPRVCLGQAQIAGEMHKNFVTKRMLKHRVFSCGHTGIRASSEKEKWTNSVVCGEEEKDALQLQLQLKDSATWRWRWPPWKQQLPERYKLIGLTSLAFVICNMDKVNLSVAIIPMSHQLGWSASTAGLVQSSFFWGYALSQLPGGWLARQLTGKKVLEIGVLGWSLATALVPVVAGFMPGLIISRILVGIGEGVSPAAATELIARTIPLTERSRAVAFVFSGLSVGSVLGLLFAPPCIENFGWESVFYIFGLLGLLWFVGFQLSAGKVLSAVPGQEATLDERRDKNMIIAENNRYGSSSASSISVDPDAVDFNSDLGVVPWRAFLKSRAIWAMIYVHFCGNWGHYTFLSWLPTYFSEELQLDLTNAALVSILPSLGSILVSSIAATFADALISKGVEITTLNQSPRAFLVSSSYLNMHVLESSWVRKLCQTIAFISPAICMTISSLDLGLSPWIIVAVLTTGLALSSFSLAGLYCSHQDISPEFASILLGLTSTAGAFPGIIGVPLTGYLLDQTHSWSLALFAPSIFFYFTGTLVWLSFASSKPQNFLN